MNQGRVYGVVVQVGEWSQTVTLVAVKSLASSNLVLHPDTQISIHFGAATQLAMGPILKIVEPEQPWEFDSPPLRLRL